MTNDEEIKEMKQVLRRIVSLLEHEGILNRYRGLEVALDIMNEPHITYLKIQEARSIILGMYGGMGTFGDLVIWRDDSEDRKAINTELNDLRNSLYTMCGKL